MPSDVSVDLVAHANVEPRAARRLPVGVGLTLGAAASLALWTAIGFGLRALLT